MWKKDYSTPLQFTEPEPESNEDEATDVADVDEASE